MEQYSSLIFESSLDIDLALYSMVLFGKEGITVEVSEEALSLFNEANELFDKAKKNSLVLGGNVPNKLSFFYNTYVLNYKDLPLELESTIQEYLIKGKNRILSQLC